MAPRIRASVTPSVGTAGEYGTWVVRCTIAEGELGSGDTIAVALPNTWHAWLRNSAKGVHSLDPASPNYVSARPSRDNVEIRCTVPEGSTEEYEKRTRDALVGPPNRCAYHTEVTVTQGVLRTGDWIDIAYGDTSGGSPGFTAALHPNGPEPVRIALLSADNGGEKDLFPEVESPLLVTQAAAPAEIVAYAPSHTRVGHEAACHVIALDSWQNAATSVHLTFAVTVAEGHADCPETVTLNPETGRCVVPFTPTAPGVLRLEFTAIAESQVPFDRLRANGKKAFGAQSNPVLCASDLPDDRVFWGDLHSHARRSFDATGDLPFHYARDVARLDFYALTDHVEQLSDEMWEEIRLADSWLV